MFFEKYGNSVFPENTAPQIRVIMTKQQYKELNDDIIKLTNDPIMMVIDENTENEPSIDDLMYTSIHVPHVCDFIIEIGDHFEFSLFNKEQEYGDEEL